MSLFTLKPVVWSAKLLDFLKNQHVYATCCNRDYEGEIKNKGDTVTVNALGSVTISNYDDTVGLSAPENVHAAGASMTIDQAKSFHFRIGDIDQVQANVTLMGSYMEEAAWGLADEVDRYLSTTVMAPGVPLINRLNNDLPYTIGPGAGDSDFYQILVDIDTRLSEENIPTGGRFCVLPPSAYGALRKDDRFVNFGTEANRATIRGTELGMVANLNIKISNNCPFTGSGPTKVWTILAGSKMATSYAEQVTKTEGYRPEREFSDAMKGLLTFGSHIFRPYALASVKVTVAPTP